MPFSKFKKVHVEDLQAGDRIWFADSICTVVSVVPEDDPKFEGCFRVFTSEPTSHGRDFIYTFPDHEFLTPFPGQSDEAFIREVARALEIMAAREAAKEAADVVTDLEEVDAATKER